MTSQPWLNQYPDNVPHTINADKYGSVTQLFQSSVEQFSDHVALECFGATMTYKQLDDAANAVAAFLQKECDVKKGDRVAIMLPNLFAYPVLMLGILKTGAVQVNVNPLYTPRELEHQLNDSGSQHIFVYKGSTSALAAVRDKTDIKNVIAVGPGDCVDPNIPAPPMADKLGDFLRLSDVLRKYQGACPASVALHGEDVLFLQYTGGTTGPSKGATLTHRNLIANTEQFKAFVPEANEPGKEVLILALPMYHIFGLMIFIAYAAIGSKAILVPNPRDMDSFISAIKNAKFTIMGGVNTLFAGMTMHPEFENVDFSAYKVAFGGGSKIFASTSERWKKFAGNHILEGFGLSETSPILTLNMMGEKEFSGTVGYPVPSTDVKILDENGAIQPVGEPGEVCAKGPQVMKGYWNRPDANAESFTSDGYFRTGDVAVMHENGQFEIVDRKKDMLIVSGFNVYPNEVESVVCELETIGEAACVGAPDEKTGEQVKLFIAPSGKGDLDVDAVTEYCRANLAAYKVPKEIIVLGELPKSNVGKILRRELRER